MASRTPVEIAELEVTTGAVADGGGTLRRVLVRVAGRPVGTTWVKGPPLDPRRARRETVTRAAGPLLRHLARPLDEDSDLLRAMRHDPLPRHPLTSEPRLPEPGELTVAIPTSRGPEACGPLLEELAGTFDVLVLENGRETPALLELCRRLGLRHHHDRRPGVTAARNRALRLANTPWILFLDDDCRTGPGGAEELARRAGGACDAGGDVGAVTGLVLPAALPGAAEVLREQIAPMDHGFVPVRHHPHSSLDRHWPARHADWMGITACALVRREAALDAGGFDERLGPGTIARGGDDDAFFSALVESGFSVLYDPSLCVRHLHRTSHTALRRQLFGYGMGMSARLWLRAADGAPALRVARLWLATVDEDRRFRRHLGFRALIPERAGALAGIAVAARLALRSRGRGGSP